VQSIILAAMSRIFFVIMLAASVWILLRGHNEPGGGFIGGLVGAAAFVVLALATSVEVARRRLLLHPVVVMALGLVFALSSGLPGVVLDGSFLLHQWATLPIGPLELKLGTTIIFDLGVYMVVVGGVLAFMFRLYEQESE